MKTNKHIIAALVWTLFGAACSDDPTPRADMGSVRDMTAPDFPSADWNNHPNADMHALETGPDAHVMDTGADTNADSRPDTAADVGEDVAADVSADMAVDATSDVGGDATADATPDATVDAAVDTAPDTAQDMGQQPPVNEPPIITVAGADNCFPETRSIDITATASDPALGTLTYAWKASAGTLVGTGSVVKFSATAPQPTGCTPYVIQVKAKSSASGLQSIASLSLYVPTLGDVNGDGAVDAGDQSAVQAAWGICAGCPEDLDNDGSVGQSDLNVVLAQFGNTGCACGDMPTVSLAAYMNCFNEHKDTLVEVTTSAATPTITWNAIGGTVTSFGSSATFAPKQTTSGICQENMIQVKIMTTTGEGVTGSLNFTVPVLGDVNADGSVNVSDLTTVLADYGVCDDPVCLSDVDGDHQVGSNDQNAVSNTHWGNSGCACF